MRIAFRDGTRLSLALIDLDHFKAINDRYGHARGDAVLRHFAAAGRRQLRGGDIFAGSAGRNSSCCCRGPAFARRCMPWAPSPPGGTGGRPRRPGCAYTMSAGVAEYCGNGVEDLFERADRALYSAKRLGRDRIEQAP
ncbi:GGDEF domain-containing protein [Shinella granuli]|uniref:GGDEF domain-containing protein n=1 Tax=Shinella granuli TaxID=323621 RepID=UPI0031EC309B